MYMRTFPLILMASMMALSCSRTPVVQDDQFLPVKGIINARDLGGYTGAGGRTVRTGKLIRAASLADLGLAGFVGTATWTACVRVPGVRVAADTGNAPAEAFWNGVSLGVRLWPPFEWSLPVSAAGTEGDLSFAASTSIAPMFGDPAAPGSAWDQPFWTPPRDPASNPGLLSAEWA